MFNCTMIRKKPSQIRYTQDSIAFYWKDNERPIGETLDQLLNCEIALDKIPKITVSYRKNILYTSDNRRLWVFKTLEKLGECETIWVKLGKIPNRKFTTRNQGTSIYIRGDPGGSVWKMWGKEKTHSPLHESQDTNESVNADIKSNYKQENEEWENDRASALEETKHIDELKSVCLSDIGYFQIKPISDAEILGTLLDECLQKDLSKRCFEVEIFPLHGKFYCSDCYILWILKNLETFGKRPKINFRRKDTSFQKADDRILNCFSDSLKLASNTSISGLVWKSIEYLNQLPTLKTVTLRISQIYFTEITVTDTYENKSIAKVLVDSNATMTVPRKPRVVKFNGKFYALDNEILWILKQMQKVSTSTLFVEANVKIEWMSIFSIVSVQIIIFKKFL